MVLGERYLFAVDKREAKDGLDALVENVTDVTGCELSRRLVEDANPHPPDGVDLAVVPHRDDLVDRLPHVAVPVDVDERHLGVPRQASDAMPEPFAGHEDRAADVEPERVVLERRAVTVAHQEAD